MGSAPGGRNRGNVNGSGSSAAKGNGNKEDKACASPSSGPSSVNGSPTAKKDKGRKRNALKSEGTPAKRTKAGGSNPRGLGGSNSHGQFYEDHASAIGKGYEAVPNNLPRLHVHIVAKSGKVLAHMLVCWIRDIGFIVCQNCGHVCSWHSTGKHVCPGGAELTVTYDDIIPDFFES